jgi:hypothetical protein
MTGADHMSDSDLCLQLCNGQRYYKDVEDGQPQSGEGVGTKAEFKNDRDGQHEDRHQGYSTHSTTILSEAP